MGPRAAWSGATGRGRARHERALPRGVPEDHREDAVDERRSREGLMAQFVATIRVRPKAEVRDPQGESVAGALRALGFEVADVRTGKEIVVRFSAADEDAARDAARTMGDQLLANPVIEDYEVSLGAPVGR